MIGTGFTDVRWVDEVESTNTDVRLGTQPGAGRSVLVADHQTRGRGRRGRSWTAPPGSALLMSVLLADRVATDAFWSVAALSVALQSALQTHGVDATIKWPNDVLVADRKLAGVLAEMHGATLVVGVGVNVHRPAHGSAELSDIATWVDDHLSEAPSRPRLREELAVAVLNGFDHWLECGHDELVERWTLGCSTLGQRVRVERGTGSVVGIAEGVDGTGALIVDGADGRVVHHVGDVVHLRPIAP